MFAGIGTVVNTLAIIAGGVAGLILKKRLKKSICDTLMQALGAAVIFIGVSGAMKGMLEVSGNGLDTKGTMILIFSLVTGTLIGELIGLKRLTEKFGGYLKEKAGAGDDSGFIDSFVSASLTVCVGAMAVIGPIEDGLMRNPSTLFAKALLDALIIMIFASITGKGAVFSAIPVAVFEGTITLGAFAVNDIMSAEVVNNMSFVGAVLIFCVGVNLMFDKKINVPNMLPAVFTSIPLTYIM